jgi:hypothetical protein
MRQSSMTEEGGHVYGPSKSFSCNHSKPARVCDETKKWAKQKCPLGFESLCRKQYSPNILNSDNSDGTVPVKLLLSSLRLSSATNKPNSVGIVPACWLKSRFKSTTKRKRKRTIRMAPSKDEEYLQLDARYVPKLVNKPKAVLTVPVISFPWRSRLTGYKR